MKIKNGCLCSIFKTGAPKQTERRRRAQSVQQLSTNDRQPGLSGQWVNRRLAMRWFFAGLLLAGAAMTTAASDELADFTWLSGCWGGTETGRVTEEHWSTPRAGLMLGFARSTNAGGQTSFEYQRIQASDETFVFVAAPGGGTPTTFTLADHGEQWFRFVNAEHDFPRVIEYRLVDEVLHAGVGDAATLEASETRYNYEFTRQACF